MVTRANIIIYKCLEGQTYNRTLKACRNLKKQGRKATRKSPAKTKSPPKGKKLNFELSVSLLADNRYDKVNVDDYPKKVIDWYNIYGKYSDSLQFVMEHRGGNKFEITVQVPNEDLPRNDARDVVRFIERIVDPGGNRAYPQ